MNARIPLLWISLLLVGCDSENNTEQPPQPTAKVEVLTLKAQPVTLSLTLPGRTKSVRSAEVRPQVSGVVLKRYFEEGSEVKAGEQLYQIDPATYQAAWEKAHAQLVNAEFVLNRNKTLIKANAVSKQTYDEAVSNYAQAKADLKTAQVNLDYTKVRAPIGGRIGRSSVTEGALVTDGQSSALATITQIDPINVDVSQSSSDLLKLRRSVEAGQLQGINSHEAAVKLMLEDGTPYPKEGRLEFSEVQVDEGTGTVTLRARFPNPDGVLLPGMFVHSEIKQGVQERGILVPQSAVMRDNKGLPYVYVLTDKNRVSSQTIQTGQMNNGMWQVTQGLQENQRVVLTDLQNLRVGSRIEPVEKSQDASSDASSSAIALSMTDSSAQ